MSASRNHQNAKITNEQLEKWKLGSNFHVPDEMLGKDGTWNNRYEPDGKGDSALDPINSRYNQGGGGTRTGTGDHQAGSRWRYHPKIGDIFYMRHAHGVVNFDQYGLEDGKMIKASRRRGGRIEVKQGGVEGYTEGAMRPCGDTAFIAGVLTGQGWYCFKADKDGAISNWKVIDSRAKGKKDGHHQSRRMNMATLGSNEEDAKCGADARFLVGYETDPDSSLLETNMTDEEEDEEEGKKKKKKWLVEINGNCDKVTEPVEVTELTTWQPFTEWTTTADGAVAWVSAWEVDGSGKPRFDEYGKQAENKPATKNPQNVPCGGGRKCIDQLPTFSKATMAVNRVGVTVYYPKS